jgi:hypothetical protein
MTDTRWPNLFIIGAPKCGTTAMSHYLAQHPQVFMSESAGIKEPFYFCSDLAVSHVTWRIRDETHYLGLFENAGLRRYRGEASTGYLVSEAAVPRILQRCDDPRFIVMVRNPIEQAYALHNEHWKNYGEHHDFETCWRWQQRRLGGDHLPPNFSDGASLQYGRIARTGEQLERVLSLVDRSRLHVVLYDDFKSDTAKSYADTLAWLGLEDDGRVHFERLNPGLAYHWEALEMGLRKIRSLRQALHLPGGLGLHALIDRFNKHTMRKPLRPAFRRELCRYFRDDVALLSRLLQRDVSHWLT